MIMWFAGFNGFGQFGGGSNDQLINAFDPTSFDKDTQHLKCESFDRNSIKISCAWSYNGIALGTKLVLSGMINKRPDNTETIDFKRPIRKVSSNDKSCLVLLDNGDVFKVCPHTLSKSKLSFIEVEKDSILPTAIRQRAGPVFAYDQPPVDFTSNQYKEKTIDVVNCDTFSVALTSTNTLYSIPSKVHQFLRHERVVKMCGGAEHVLVLTSNGDVYAFGSSSRGQLGLGSTNTEESPVIVDALAGIKIVDVACGSWHSAAVSAFGDLYVWGWNVNGQLGRPVLTESTLTYSSGRTEQIKHKLASVFPLPQVVDLPKTVSNIVDRQENTSSLTATNPEKDDLQDQFEVVRVFCGSRHTVVQTKCQQFLATGWNEYRQCAMSGEDISSFTRVDGLPSDTSRVSCGSWCTIFK